MESDDVASEKGEKETSSAQLTSFFGVAMPAYAHVEVGLAANADTASVTCLILRMPV